MTVGAPTTIAGAMLPSPAMWNMGAPRTRLVVCVSAVVCSVIVWPVRLVCVRIAPLGAPVVPEVYMISAGLSLGTSTIGGAALPSTRSASRSS